jgi:hypothetical protein
LRFGERFRIGAGGVKKSFGCWKELSRYLFTVRVRGHFLGLGFVNRGRGFYHICDG